MNVPSDSDRIADATGPRRRRCPARTSRFLAVLLGGVGICPARAVLFYSTADPTYNISAAGTIAETGWGYEGKWGNFLGTAIAPNFFITAKHVSGTVGNTFNSVAYTTVASYAAPAGVDLRIWQVSGTLPAWAPLYSNTDEVGQSLVVIGRGKQRGNDVTVSGATLTDLRGWEWGSSDGVQRWGENVVSDTLTSSVGDMLAAEFNSGKGPNEAHLAVGDSGGAVFIQDSLDSLWKLAGINYSVDGSWSYTGGNDKGFSAAIFDTGGLYVGSQNNWTYHVDTGLDIPSRFYSTRISSYNAWILSVIPEPRDYALVTAGLLAGLAVWRRRRVH